MAYISPEPIRISQMGVSHAPLRQPPPSTKTPIRSFSLSSMATVVMATWEGISRRHVVATLKRENNQK